MADWIGWVATAMVVSSYFFRKQVTLRRIQAAAALTWLAYGVLIQAPPVIGANVIVFATALWSSFARSSQEAA